MFICGSAFEFTAIDTPTHRRTVSGMNGINTASAIEESCQSDRQSHTNWILKHNRPEIDFCGYCPVFAVQGVTQNMFSRVPRV